MRDPSKRGQVGPRAPALQGAAASVKPDDSPTWLAWADLADAMAVTGIQDAEFAREFLQNNGWRGSNSP